MPPYIQAVIDQNELQKGTGVLLSLSIILIYHQKIYNSEQQSYELLHTVCFFLFNSLFLEKEANCKNVISNIHIHNMFFLVDNSSLQIQESSKRSHLSNLSGPINFTRKIFLSYPQTSDLSCSHNSSPQTAINSVIGVCVSLFPQFFQTPLQVPSLLIN